MLILITAKEWLTICGVIPVQEQYLALKLKKYKMLLNRIHVILMFVLLVSYNISVLYFHFFETKSITEYFESVIFVLYINLVIVLYTLLIWKAPELIKFMDDLEKLMTERYRNSTVQYIYSYQIEETEKFAKMLCDSLKKCVQLYVIPTALISFYKYFTTDSSNDSFQLVLVTTLPWNWKTPFGYLAAILLQYIWVHTGSLLLVSFLILFAGFSSLFGALATDIKQCVTDTCSKLADFQEDSLRAGKRIGFIRNLNETMQFHADAKEFTDRFFTTFAVILTIIFTTSSTILCNGLLSLNTALQINIFTEIIRSICHLTYEGIYMGVICSFGDKVTTRFGEISDAICECSWYELPLDEQKVLLTMLIVAQKPVYIQGLSNTQCTREFLKKMAKATFSCFLVIYEFKH